MKEIREIYANGSLGFLGSVGKIGECEQQGLGEVRCFEEMKMVAVVFVEMLQRVAWSKRFGEVWCCRGRLSL
jgi:hypothetical protein